MQTPVGPMGVRKIRKSKMKTTCIKFSLRGKKSAGEFGCTLTQDVIKDVCIV